MRPLAAVLLATVSTVAAANPVLGPSKLDPAWQERSKALFKTAIEIPTVQGRGQLPRMAEYLAGEYRRAGWAAEDVKVLPYKSEADDPTAVFVARWKGTGGGKRKPILIIAHMDVVEAKRADWKEDPFAFVEKAGYFYGRGTSDDKQGVIGTTAALFKLRASGFKPDRDIIVFYTGDEEVGGKGAALGVGEWRPLLDSEYVLNADAGGGAFATDGRSLGFGIQTAEKIFQSYHLTARNRGGHSSRPRPDNAIYDLAGALQKLSAHRFTPMLNETTRAYFTERAKQESGKLGADMRAWLANPQDGAAADAIEANELETGMTRTRCVATMLEGGHAQNALPQMAQATVNCRIMPGIDPKTIEAELKGIAGSAIEITPFADQGNVSEASPLRPDVVKAYTDAVRRTHGASVQIIPQMSTGATDGLYFRAAGIPVYGIDGSYGISPGDKRAHGLDERIPVKAFYDNVLHWESIIRALAGR